MLVVALGLSYINHTGVANRFDDEYYNDKDGSNIESMLVPHSTNEGYYIYDVLK
ncbi:hypothetical protein [Yeosuana sp. AK3]